MDGKNILVTIPLQDPHRAWLEKIGEGQSFTFVRGRANASEEMVQSAEIILGNVKPGMLPGAKNLKFLQLESAGSAEYAAPGVLPEGVKLCNSSGAYGRTISEHMVALAFAMQKKLYLYRDNMKEHLWRDEGKVPMIAGSTVLVLGMGDIGGNFARRMHALGCRVLAVRRNRTAAPEYVDGLYQMDQLEELLPQADIAACSLPDSKATYHLLDGRRLAMMKPGAVLINVGRGNLIPAEDLTAALKAGRPKMAAIDVAETEPLPKDSPLWDLPNLLITPHISGGYHTQDILDSVVRIAGENLRAFLNGEPLKNEVDFETGYRKFRG